MTVPAPQRIVVVEDEAIVALHLVATIRSLGYEVVATENTGLAAIATVDRTRPDLVLMDIKLKGTLDGISTAARIRDDFHVPVVFLTAYSDEGTLARAKMVQPYGFIVKPFEERELRSIIEIALHKHGMERRLVENERWLSTILEGIADAVVVVDRNARVRFMNTQAQSFASLDARAAHGARLGDAFAVVPGPDPLPESGIVGNGTWSARFMTRDGKVVDVEGTSSDVRGSAEDAERVLVFRDVTARKRAEAKARHLASVVEASDDAIISMAIDGTILSWNRGAEVVYGYTANEAVGTSITRIEPPDLAEESAGFMAALARGEPVEHHETRRRRRNGDIITVTLTLSPVKDGLGVITGAVDISRDITALKQAAEERKVADDRIAEIERLNEMNRLKTAFINHASHELRTPMTPIRLQLAILRKAREEERSPVIGHAVDVLERNLERLTQLVDDIVRTARFQAGEFSMEYEATDVRSVVDDALALLEAGPAADRIRVEADPIPFSCDGDLVAEALRNLMETALSWVPERATIPVTGHAEGDRVAFRVGVGDVSITDDEIGHVFDAFAPVDASLPAYSSRTSLARFVARTIAEHHEGSLDLERSGDGVTFVMRLPRHTSPRSAAPEGSEGQKPVASSREG